MMYGSGPPTQGRFFGSSPFEPQVIGGASLEPRVLGGGLAALGAKEASAYSAQLPRSEGGISYGQPYTGQIRTAGREFDCMYSFGPSTGRGSINSINSAPFQSRDFSNGLVPRELVVGGRELMPRAVGSNVMVNPVLASSGGISSIGSYPVQKSTYSGSNISGNLVGVIESEIVMMPPIIEGGSIPKMRQSGQALNRSALPGNVIGQQPTLMASEGQQLFQQRMMAANGSIVPQRPIVMPMPAAAVNATSTMSGATNTMVVVEAAASGPALSDPNAVCSILPIPADYMIHIREEDLKQVQDAMACTIQVSQPSPNSGATDWEVRLFGSAEARAQAHQALEDILNDRLGTAEPQQSSEVLNLPNEVMMLLFQEDIDFVKADCGCDIQIAESPEGGEVGWIVTLSGSDEALAAGHRAIDELLNQRVLAQQQQTQEGPSVEMGADAYSVPTQQMPMQMPTQQMPMQMGEPMTMTGDGGEGMIPGTMAEPLASADAQQGAGMTSVLQLPNDYMTLLFQEDIDNIKSQFVCDIQILEAEEGGVAGGWTITLYGSDQARDDGHRAIEDLLTQRLAQVELQQLDGTGAVNPDGAENQMSSLSLPTADQPRQMEEEGEGNLVPCTILPIPYEYLKRLFNLDAIQEVTRCTIEVKPPEQDCPDWQLALYGDATQRQKAHQAIEDTLNAAMANEVEGSGTAQA